MLQLKNVTKNYVTASETVEALKGINLSFRQNEFVSVLGPSGCGKTTLLNLIGGLDHYTSGDLIIAGKSTKEYSDRDWDVYRNHRVGFIFQSYNLIPHQTVLGNVELALTIAGVSKEERVARAKRALDRVGLSGQYHKRPNQLSGGQCQRVAIARALVNDPEILLADEPTGALDTVTSKQIMELIREISGERLVIMVTHNPEIAEEYSTRIIRLIDGLVTEDTNPFSSEDETAECAAIAAAQLEQELAETSGDKPSKKKKKAKRERAKMSFLTAFMLSLKNLFTKRGRTALTAFAGSIGIIGIALILAVSQGMTAYIDHVQETTLSTYPLTLESTTVDASALIESILGKDDDITHDTDSVHKDPLIAELVEALSKVETNENDLAAFKVRIEEELAKETSALKEALMGIGYAYDINIPIYTKNQDGDIIKSDTGALMTEMLAEFLMGIATSGNLDNPMLGNNTDASSGNMSSAMMGSMMGVQMWEELLPSPDYKDGEGSLVNDILFDQYDVVHGRWPAAKDELVLVLNQNNELDDLTLYALGLLSEENIDAIIDSAVSGTPIPEDKSGRSNWTYEEICELTFKAIFPYNFYQPRSDGTYFNAESNTILLEYLYEDAMELKVVGIIRPQKDAEATMLKGSIVYTKALTEHIIAEAESSAVVMAQMANPDYDILTGLPFDSTTGELTNGEKRELFSDYVAEMSEEERADVFVSIKYLQAEKAQLKAQTDSIMNMFSTESSKTMIIDMIVAGLGETDVDPETVRGYFEKMSVDDLKTLIRPQVEEQVRSKIHQSVDTSLAQYDDATMSAMLTAELAGATDEDYALYYDEITVFSDSTYEDRLVEVGKVDLDSPARINLYASSFENKDLIVDFISEYNDSVSEEHKISYTDFLGIMMSSITTIINAITYVLIAFVSISLVVSSIMIGVITLISVQERTKEIGVLRAIGASKRDVSSMFNAETIIIGLCSGVLGIVVTYLLCIPINLILHAATGIANLSAILPFGAAAILVAISVCLTLFSGLIPSRSAAKKDPVVALRTE